MDRQKVARLLRVARPLRNEGGFVLLITLLVVLLLTVIIFEIDFQSRADLRAAGNFRDDLAAYYIALSGIAAGKEFLRDDSKNDLKTNRLVDDLNEFWAVTPPPIPVGEGEFSGKITDEAGKFNLNYLINRTGTPPADTAYPFKEQQLRNLFELLDVDPNLVDPIIDWLDVNFRTEPNGAENETYQSLPSPYPTKNGPLDTLEEILYIKGITPQVYQKIAPYLTISTDGRINVNTADPIIIQSIDERIDESSLESIMRGVPYDNATNFCTALRPRTCTQIPNLQINDFSVTSNIYSLKSHGTVRNTRKTIHAIWNRTNKTYLYYKVE